MKPVTKILYNDILGEWKGVSLADDLFEYELQLREKNCFELLDIENGELVIGEYSIEYAHYIFYFILKAGTEVFVFQWDGKRELKNNDCIFIHAQKTVIR